MRTEWLLYRGVRIGIAIVVSLCWSTTCTAGVHTSYPSNTTDEEKTHLAMQLLNEALAGSAVAAENLS